MLSRNTTHSRCRAKSGEQEGLRNRALNGGKDDVLNLGGCVRSSVAGLGPIARVTALGDVQNLFNAGSRLLQPLNAFLMDSVAMAQASFHEEEA